MSFIKRGGWLLIVGLVLSIVGGITLAVSGTASGVRADSAEVPEPLEFVSAGEPYRLALVTEPAEQAAPGQPGQPTEPDGPAGDDAATSLDCTLYSPDGETSDVALGTVDVPAGATTITCQFPDARDTSGYVYSAAPVTAPVAIVVGIAALAVGLLTLGVGAIVLVVRRPRGEG